MVTAAPLPCASTTEKLPFLVFPLSSWLRQGLSLRCCRQLGDIKKKNPRINYCVGIACESEPTVALVWACRHGCNSAIFHLPLLLPESASIWLLVGVLPVKPVPFR